jgi:hypothetical protein
MSTPAPRPGPIQFRSVELEPHLEARSDGSLGQVAVRDLGRYYEALNRARPTFSRDEALAIIEVCNGTLWEPWSIPLLWASVSDAKGLGERWSIDQAALVDRLRALTYIEILAIIDSAERVWRQGTTTGPALIQTLEASGLIAPTPQETRP